MRRKFKNESEMHKALEPYYLRRLGIKLLMDNRRVKDHRSDRYKQPDWVGVCIHTGRLWSIEEKNNDSPLTDRIYSQTLHTRKNVNDRTYEIALNNVYTDIKIIPTLPVGMMIVTMGGVEPTVSRTAEDFNFPTQILEAEVHKDTVYFRPVYEPPKFDYDDDELSEEDRLDKGRVLDRVEGVSSKGAFLNVLPDLTRLIEYGEGKDGGWWDYSLEGWENGSAADFWLQSRLGRKKLFRVGVNDVEGLGAIFHRYVNERREFSEETKYLDSKWHLVCHVPEGRRKNLSDGPKGCEYSKIKSSTLKKDGESLFRLNYFHVVDASSLADRLIEYIEEQISRLM